MLNYFCVTDEGYRLIVKNPVDAPPPVTRLVCGRRDSAAFQVILQSDRHYSVHTGTGEWVSCRNWQAGPHERLRLSVRCALPVRMYIQEFLPDDDELQKADILLHQDTRESRAHTPTAVWCELLADEHAAPGDYPIDITVYAAEPNGDEVTVARETLVITVKNVLLPLCRDYKFNMNLWQHTSNIARQHDVPLWSDEHFQVLRHYAASLAALGQKAVTVIVSQIPWRGQSCFMDKQYNGNVFEYSMIPITRGVDGVFRYDYSIMQRYIDLCREMGMGREIEVMGLINVWEKPILTPQPFCPEFPEPLRLRYLDESDGCMKYVRDADVMRDYARSLEQYFIQTGQIDDAYLSADEPGDMNKFRRSMELFEELCPRFRYAVSINHSEFIAEFQHKLTAAVPYLNCCLQEYDALTAFHRQHPDKLLSWYICCGGGYPNHFLRTPPLESRVTAPLTYCLGFDGFGRWAYTCWPDAPRRDIRYSEFEAGDTCFVYPGRDGRVLLSLRYKNLQRGVVDYELARMAEEKLGRAAARDALRTSFPGNIPQDMITPPASGMPPCSNLWADHNAAKERLLTLLENA